jgi:hypothetical protein
MSNPFRPIALADQTEMDVAALRGVIERQLAKSTNTRAEIAAILYAVTGIIRDAHPEEAIDDAMWAVQDKVDEMTSWGGDEEKQP